MTDTGLVYLPMIDPSQRAEVAGVTISSCGFKIEAMREYVSICDNSTPSKLFPSFTRDFQISVSIINCTNFIKYSPPIVNIFPSNTCFALIIIVAPQDFKNLYFIILIPFLKFGHKKTGIRQMRSRI